MQLILCDQYAHLCNFMFYDVIPHQMMSELCISIDLTCTSKLHIGLPVICHGVYVMHEGLPVT